MISVFSEHITNRLTYVLEFCFLQRGFEYQVISNTTEWSKIRSFRINYSHLNIPCDYLIKPHDLLFEEGIREDIQITLEGDEPRIDGMTDELALIFRFMSRYEEYLPHERDEHDRYKAANSELVKLNLSHTPIVDMLNKKIWLKLGLDYAIVEKGFECVPSFDINIAGWVVQLVRDLPKES
jgi:hypothetical protein